MENVESSSFKDIKSGDLIAWTNTDSIYSKLIRLFTLSEITHVGIAIEEDGVLYVVEAVSPAIRKVPLVDRLPFLHLPMDVEMTDYLTDTLNSYIGKEYSKLQAVLSLFNIYIDDDLWYCTEKAYDFYSKAGIEFDKRLTPTRFFKQAMMRSKRVNNIEA